MDEVDSLPPETELSTYQVLSNQLLRSSFPSRAGERARARSTGLFEGLSFQPKSVLHQTSRERKLPLILSCSASDSDATFQLPAFRSK